MVKTNFLKKLSIMIIILALVVGAGFVGFKSLNTSKDKKEPPTVQTSTKKEGNDGATSSSEALKAPAPTEVDFCKNLREIVTTVVGSSPSNAAGRTAKTKNSKVTDCSYAKDDKRVNVRLYEYGSEAEAKTDLANLQIKGYETKNKGKFIVSVLVVGPNGPITDSASKVLNVAQEKL